MSSSRLAFHARSSSAHVDEEIADCSFQGEHGEVLGMMTENGIQICLAWHDGEEGEDQAVVSVALAELWSYKLSLTFDRNAYFVSKIPYDGIDITYANEDDRFLDLADVLARLFSSPPDRVRVHHDA